MVNTFLGRVWGRESSSTLRPERGSCVSGEFEMGVGGENFAYFRAGGIG